MSDSKKKKAKRTIFLVVVLVLIMSVVAVEVHGKVDPCPDGDCTIVFDIPDPVSKPVRVIRFTQSMLIGRTLFDLFDVGSEVHVAPDDWRPEGTLVCPDPDNPDFCYRSGGK